MSKGDIAIIVTPDDTHFEIAKYAIDHGNVKKLRGRERDLNFSSTNHTQENACSYYICMRFRILLSNQSKKKTKTWIKHKHKHQTINHSGLHCMITKPAVKTLTEQIELMKHAEKHGVIAAVEFHKRFDPMYADAREKIR